MFWMSNLLPLPVSRSLRPFSNGGWALQDDACQIPSTNQNFSDFMLHNIGTGDGIVQTQHAQRPARGVSIEQSPEIQQLRQQLTPQQQGQSQPPRAAVADRCDWKQHLLDVQKFDETGARVLDQRTANEIRTAPLWGLRVIVSRATDSRSRRRKRERALA
jgi:hypothetical protein